MLVCVLSCEVRRCGTGETCRPFTGWALCSLSTYHPFPIASKCPANKEGVWDIPRCSVGGVGLRHSGWQQGPLTADRWCVDSDIAAGCRGDSVTICSLPRLLLLHLIPAQIPDIIPVVPTGPPFHISSAHISNTIRVTLSVSLFSF